MSNSGLVNAFAGRDDSMYGANPLMFSIDTTNERCQSIF